jgi:hypothetical protein
MKNDKSALERFEGEVTRLIHEIVELNRKPFQAASRAMIERIK